MDEGKACRCAAVSFYYCFGFTKHGPGIARFPVIDSFASSPKFTVNHPITEVELCKFRGKKCHEMFVGGT